MASLPETFLIHESVQDFEKRYLNDSFSKGNKLSRLVAHIAKKKFILFFLKLPLLDASATFCFFIRNKGKDALIPEMHIYLVTEIA